MRPYKIVLATSFKKSIKYLQKRYPNVKTDVRSAIRELIENPQIGPLIRGGSGARKVRVRNTNLQRGKSAGYRLIYYLATDPEPTIYLLLLYAKSDKADVTNRELAQLLNDLLEDE